MTESQDIAQDSAEEIQTESDVPLKKRLSEHAKAVAVESDRWFLASVQGADRASNWVFEQIGKGFAAGFHQVAKRVKPPTPDGSRVRITNMLRTESRRRGMQVTEEEFGQFSGQIANLLELVLSGTIAIDDIGFESQEEPALFNAEDFEVTDVTFEEAGIDPAELGIEEPASVAGVDSMEVAPDSREGESEISLDDQEKDSLLRQVFIENLKLQSERPPAI